MADNLELRVRFKALGDLAKRFEGIRSKATGLTKTVDKLKGSMASTAGELKDLGKVERTAARYSGLRDKMKGDTLAMTELREKSRRLEQQLKQTAKPTQKLRNEFLRARKETTRLEEKHRSHYALLNRLQKELKSAGFDTRKFSNSESDLKTKIERTTKALGDQANQLDKLRDKRKKLDALKSRADSIMRGGIGAAKYGAAAGITGGLAIGGGLAAVDRATKSQVETQMLAKSVQVNVEFLQGMSAAVSPAGFNQDNIIDLVEELNNKMGESIGIEQMGAVSDSLQILGLNYERIKKLAPEQQFRAITDAAMRMSDQQQAASAVDMLMGGEANKLLGVLKQTGGSTQEILSNFKALNMQTEQSRKGAMAYQLQMAKVKTITSGLSAEFFGVLGGALAPALARLTDWVKANESLVQAKVVSAAKQLAGALIWVVENMASIVTWAKRIAIGFAVFFSVMAALKGYITVVTAFNLAAGSGVGVFSALKATLGGVGKAAMFIGKMVRAAGLLMMANPIILAVTLLATAVYLIYKNWEPIKAFFTGLWDSIKSAFGSGVEWIKTKFEGLTTWLSEFKGRFFQYGVDLIDGLKNGIVSRATAVKDAVVGVAGDVADWFKRKLEINSPSRLFKKYGGFISQGLAIGISDKARAAVDQAKRLSQQVAQAGQPSLAGVQVYDRPPISSFGQGGASSNQNTYHIEINATPGMDAQAIARAVSQELDRRDRAAAARARSRFYDN